MATNRLSVFFIALIAAVGVASARADEPKASRKQKIELLGKLGCVGCHLEKEYAAEAQCTVHAKHAQGFLADDGTLYTILDNARGHILITEKKLAGTLLRVEGFTFPKAQVLEVVRFKKKQGDQWVQVDYCKNCGFEPGDNKGKDLCEDCAK
jgi:hypothetical protein